MGTISITEKNGKLIALKAVKGDEDALLMTDDGTMIRISLDNVATYGRTTQGVKLMNVNDSRLTTISIVGHEEEEQVE